MRAHKAWQAWAAISGLRRLMRIETELAASQAARELAAASATHQAAQDTVERARAGWQRHLAGAAVDPAVLVAWQYDVRSAAGHAAAAANEVTTAEDVLHDRRQACFDAQRLHDVASERARIARAGVSRRREEFALAEISDRLGQQSVRMP